MSRQARIKEEFKATQKKQRHNTMLIVLMTLSFYVSWTPYAIYGILRMIGVLLPRLVVVLSILFAKSGTIINPILYIFFNKGVSIFKLDNIVNTNYLGVPKGYIEISF